jgi:hypothetical protein
MLKKIFNAIFGIVESTVKESVFELKTLVKFYAYIGLFLIVCLILLLLTGIYNIIF